MSSKPPEIEGELKSKVQRALAQQFIDIYDLEIDDDEGDNDNG